MTWHGYIVVESVAPPEGAYNALLAILNAISPDSDLPAELLQSRDRLDGLARLYEAAFDPDDISVAALLAHLAGIGLEGATVDASPASFGGGQSDVISFIYESAEAIRVTLLGTTTSTWAQSLDECQGYLGEHLADWDTQEGA